MKITAKKLNRFLLFKLPSAWLCGVRVEEIDEKSCRVNVRHRWINQNPFNSMYFAVQAMAAELTTGALVMAKIQKENKKISMLVAQNNATFSKKATGKISFFCEEGEKVDAALKKTLETGAGQTIWMHSRGVDENGVEVSSFNFEWTVRVKQ